MPEMDNRRGLIMTGALMIVAGLVGTDEEVDLARTNINSKSIKPLTEKYFDMGKELIQLVKDHSIFT